MKLKLGLWIDIEALKKDLADLNLLSHHQKSWEDIIRGIQDIQVDNIQ